MTQEQLPSTDPPEPAAVPGPPTVAAPAAVPGDRWRASLPAVAVFGAGALFGVVLAWGAAEVADDGRHDVRVVREGGMVPHDRPGPFGR